MADNASVGDVHVDVHPDASKFLDRLRAVLRTLNDPGFKTRIDPDVSGFNTRLRAALAGLPGGPAAKVIINPDLTGFNARLRAAVAALPGGVSTKVKVDPDLTGFKVAVKAALKGFSVDVNVDANTKVAAASIAALRKAAAGTIDIAVDFNTKAAAASLAAIRAAAGTTTIEIKVKVTGDTTALAQIAAVASAASALAGMNPTVNLNTAGGIGGARALTTALLTLGSAAVPAIAAATAAVGSLGGMLLSVGAGAGVGILALTGVVGAVKALNDAQADQSKTAATLARQDKQSAAGADQVRSAVAALANTRANAAVAGERAAQSIADSERSLASAQRDALRAQQDITRAREDAKDSLEDLNSSLKANATSIKQANLDLADAEAALEKVKNLPANNRQRVEAEIAYERAVQQIDDLTVRQGRLKEEKAESDKQGIEGSKQVVAATEKYTDAQERVQAAERAVQDARKDAAETARQNAYSIQQAQQAVVAATRAAATAAVTSSDTAGAAADKLREKMEALSPAGQRFAQFLFSQKAALLDLRKTAETGFLPGLESGLDALLLRLPSFSNFVGRVAESLGRMADQGLRALAGPKWEAFFSYMNSSAVPTMEQLFTSTGNVALGFANLVVAFSPVQRQLSGGLVELTEKFARWSATLGDNATFQRFIEYATTRGPVVIDTLLTLSDAVLRIAQAAAPVGDVVLTVLTAVADAINAIPIDVLTLVVSGIAAFRIAATVAPFVAGLTTALYGLATGATTAGAAGATLVSFLGGPWVIGIAAAVLALGHFVSVGTKQKESNNDLRDSLVTLSAAYAQAGSSSDSSIQGLLKQNKALQELVLNAQRFGLSIADVTAATQGDGAARERVLGVYDAQIARTSAMAEQYTRLASEGGKNAEMQAILNEAGVKSKEELYARIPALQAQRDAVADSTAEAQRAAEAERLVSEATTGQSAKLKTLSEILHGSVKPSVESFGSALGILAQFQGDANAKGAAFAVVAQQIADSSLSGAEKAGLFRKVLEDLGSVSRDNKSSMEGLQGAFNSIATSSISAKDKIDLLRQAMQQMYGAAQQQVDADLEMQFSKASLGEQLKSNTAGFDIEKAAADGNTSAVRGNINALRDALKALQEKYIQDIANGQSVEQATATYQTNRKAILDSIPPAQQNTAAVKDLTAAYGAIPPTKKTDVSTPGLDVAINDLIKAHVINLGLSQSPPWSKDRIGTEVAVMRSLIFGGYAGDPRAYKAAGGPIEGWSPTSTADNIPIWATAGEFMHPVNTVDYYGVGAMEAIRRRAIPREVIQGYATGGQVKFPPTGKWPVKIPNQVKVDVDGWWKKYDNAVAAYNASIAGGSDIGDVGAGPGFTTWPSSPSAQRGDSGVWRSIVNLIRSTGPVSGAFGNSYRAGDPLWHGSGRAVDWMGFNQDALAGFLASKRPLELIHRTGSRDYAYTRGVNKGSFSQGLMNEHRNHIHIAMAGGGLVQAPPRLYDSGGILPPGATYAINGTGRNEYINTEAQQAALVGAATSGGDTINLYGVGAEGLAQFDAHRERKQLLQRIGRPG